MSATVAERVAAGAAFLDEHAPGWHDRISLMHFTIADGCGCILGQLYADQAQVSGRDHGFDWAVRQGGLVDIGSAKDLGFNALYDAADSDRGMDEQIFADYEALTAEWTRLILARRGGAS